MSIILKRIYDEPPRLGGHRILIDRVWPRGISKEDADLEEWMKEITPSPSLRKWFNHDPEKFEKFKQAYKDELHHDEEKQKILRKLKEMSENERVVLLYGAKDEKHNHAVVLKEVLEDM
ncbi:DUF488 domain-containing protein [Rossellomorea sp. KS-H15a]|uniref:DUF488 domain-containing protein n=1 Tax=Rossellomorea sp. KS-H15a TaxID=2963940 RepID=UPI0020C655AC|nr:DUF488 family protein [Rossellomorea sp. KS-H15a]UTE78759.1 DUF488 family protein [Rossellomorea sp. KS-H15a]